ncbi:MAG TPA: hypothetical protein VNE58_02785 [Casimicrobiaceae bacterium]|nr:hypothetical protein [Casimicrobiaceae bacterium]
MVRYLTAATFVVASLCVFPAAAQTAAEDEARIEELIRREQRAPATGAASPPRGTAPGGVEAASTESPEIAPAALEHESFAEAAIGAEPAEAPAEPAPVADAPLAEPTIFGDDVMPRDPDEIALADIGAHVGKNVRVRSHGGRARVGRIESVGDAGLTLTTPMGGGFAKYTLPYSQITRIERL